MNKQELEKIEQDYFIFSTKKYEDNKYSEADLLLYMELIKQHFYQDGIINCPYIEDNNIVDTLIKHENGEATSKRLRIDKKYTVQDSKTLEIYVLNEKISAKIGN